MNNTLIIPIERFREAFERVGWKEEKSKDGHYLVWTNPSDSEVWTRLPLSQSAPDYSLYQEKNTRILLYALGLPETDNSAYDLLSQLKAYNYKLINRIVSTKDNKNTAIPYELATIVPEKNIEAFRYFYQTKRKKSRALPIEKFEFNHTEVGSFVIPVSIIVDEELDNTLLPLANDTNLALHEYLNAIDTLVHIPRNDAVSFADQVISESIDSKIVKDFFGRENSIAKTREKYGSQISHITIGSKGSALLDYGLKEEERIFKEVDLGAVEILSEEYIRVLEERELQADDTKIDIHEAKIDVIVEAIDTSGRVKFTVLSINHSEVKSPFKAFSSELPKAKLDQFADFFKNSGAATITGDLSKSKGKIGRIIVDNLGEKSSNEINLTLL